MASALCTEGFNRQFVSTFQSSCFAESFLSIQLPQHQNVIHVYPAGQGCEDMKELDYDKK